MRNLQKLLFLLLLAALAVISLAGLRPATALAGPIGSVQQLGGATCRFPDAAYDPTSRHYLVVFVDYSVPTVFGRLVDQDGVPLGPAPFRISDGTMSLYPSVAANPAAGELLVAWADEGRPNPVYGRRVRASDGTLLGDDLPIAARAHGGYVGVAFSATSSRWLVVFQDPTNLEIYGRLLAADGTPVSGDIAICQDAAYSGYVAVSWGSGSDRFLVTWDHDVDNVGDIHGQMVDAAGSLVGPPIVITTIGKAGRSNSAYDPVADRFLVAYNDCSRPGNSFDQSSTFVRSDGTVDGAPLPIAATAAFEGDTLLGGDISFAPGARRYLSSFTATTGMHVQKGLDAAGAPVGGQVELAPGDFGALTNAVDTERNRFITAWENLAGPKGVWARVFEAACAPACAGRTCGDDGCGGSCGSCVLPATCQAGQCVACTPSCAGKACGADDGCGNPCGGCDDAGAQPAGPDGGQSGRADAGGAGGLDAGASGPCDGGEGCPGCTPRCTGKACGDDGCGGSCGTCGEDELCTDGACGARPNEASGSCGCAPPEGGSGGIWALAALAALRWRRGPRRQRALS